MIPARGHTLMRTDDQRSERKGGEDGETHRNLASLCVCREKGENEKESEESERSSGKAGRRGKKGAAMKRREREGAAFYQRALVLLLNYWTLVHLTRLPRQAILSVRWRGGGRRFHSGSLGLIALFLH